MKGAWLVVGAVGILVAGLGAQPGPDPDRGRDLFERRCAGCHAIDRAKAGPPLRGVFGRRAAADPNFPYSDALRRTAVKWDPATLDRWLTDPESVAPGNDMAFRMTDAAERAAIIEWLRRLPAK